VIAKLGACLSDAIPRVPQSLTGKVLALRDDCDRVVAEFHPRFIYLLGSSAEEWELVKALMLSAVLFPRAHGGFRRADQRRDWWRSSRTGVDQLVIHFAKVILPSSPHACSGIWGARVAGTRKRRAQEGY
jgi:hypothetical protein